MADDGIPGLPIGLSAAGALLMWSALRNVSPVDTLREVLGQTSTGKPISTPIASVISGVRPISAVSGSGAADAPGSSVAGRTPGDVGAAQLVAAARAMEGVPYKWASATATAVDCSGLVVVCLRQIGIPNVPRFTTATFGTWAKKQGATKVKPSQFQAGDVILRTGHMGIAVSGTRLIHAPHTGTVVKEAAIWDLGNWWGWRLFGGTATEEPPTR